MDKMTNSDALALVDRYQRGHKVDGQRLATACQTLGIDLNEVEQCLNEARKVQGNLVGRGTDEYPEAVGVAAFRGRTPMNFKGILTTPMGGRTGYRRHHAAR